MPIRVRKVNGYRVSTPGGTKAKATMLVKAKRQANLLRAIDHGWRPTGAPARDIRGMSPVNIEQKRTRREIPIDVTKL